MAEQLMNGLSRAEATAEANRLRQAGHSTQDINNKLLGHGRWKNNKGKTSNFKAIDNGGGKIVFKEVNQIRSTKNKVETRRTTNKVISTPDKAKRQAADNLTKKINGKGLEADHKHKLNKTANALKGLSKSEQAKFLQGYEKVGNPLGHQPSNIQALDRASHQEKTNNEKALERNLKKMSKESKLSRIFRMRVRVNKYNTISDVLKNNVPSPTVDMGIDMDEIAPHKRFHSVPGGLVPPISYI